jgi:peptidoglycan/LPS O-acetylase OafA/YrhL
VAALLFIAVLGTVAVWRFYEFGAEWDKRKSMLLWFPFMVCPPIVMIMLLLVSWREVTDKWLGFTPLPWIGKISYSLYLWHVVVLQNWENALRRAPEDSFIRGPVVFTVLMLTLVFLVSWASYEFIEAPFLSKRKT